ncbi:MAG: hypothetical protein ACXAE3_17435 [Candidatus Kariarchaeaceae archaeon]
MKMLPTQLSESYNESIIWDNTGFNLSYDVQASERWNYNIDFSASEYKLKQAIHSQLTISNLARTDTVSLKNNVGNEIRGAALRWNNDFKIFTNHTLSAGIEIENHQVSTFALADGESLFHENDTAVNLNLYGSFEFPITDKIDFKLGVRTSKYLPTDRLYLSPRTSLSYFPGPSLEFKISGGVYNQFLRTQIYEDRFGKSHSVWLLANEEVRVLKSAHVNLSSIYRRDNLLVKLEAYSKKSRNELERIWVVNGFNQMTGIPLASNFKTFYGSGHSIGLDLLTQIQLDHYSANLSYTLSKNTITVKAIDSGTPFPAPDDRRHELSLLNQVSSNKWTLSNTWVYGSGLPFVSVKAQEDRDIREITYEERIDRLPDYFRIDFAVDYNFKLWNQDFHAGISVYNILDRENSDQVQYMYNLREENSSTGQEEDFIFGSEIQLLPRTIDISLEWHF